jgi:hypothetical protein
MRAKSAFAFPASYARPRDNALVSAYMTVTNLVCPDPRVIVERDQVLSFLLDEICRTPRGSQAAEEALLAAALKELAVVSPNTQPLVR